MIPLFKAGLHVPIKVEQVWKGLFIVLPLKNKMAKAVRKKAAKKNKLGVKNSLVNNINARKKKVKSRTKEKSTVTKASYDKMEENWGKEKK